jgi:hypothetical protein
MPPEALWGRPDYAVGLLGDRVSEVSARRGMLPVNRFGSAQAVHEYFKNHYGPTINAYQCIGDNRVLADTLDAQLVELAEQHISGGVMQWEYLVLTARKR